MVAFLAGCTRGTSLTVVNNSSSTITNVIASGAGFSRDFGTIAPGQQRRLGVSVQGETGARLEFDAEGLHYSTPKQGYFEGGPAYKVTVTVAPDFCVNVTTSTYF